MGPASFQRGRAAARRFTASTSSFRSSAKLDAVTITAPRSRARRAHASMSIPASASTQSAMPPAGSAWLGNPRFARWQGRLTGSVLLGLGVRLALARRG